MIVLNEKQYHIAMFADEFVNNTDMDIKNKYIKISLSGGFLDDEGCTFLSKAEIIITDWTVVKVQHLKKENPNDPGVLSDESLSETTKISAIIEFNYNRNELQLVGFGLHGGWVTWTFTNPKVEVYGEVEGGD